MELTNIKDKLIQVTNDINSKTTFDELIEKMYLIYKVEKGLQDIKFGKYIDHGEIKKQVNQWKQ